jgi:hypothetical protein
MDYIETWKEVIQRPSDFFRKMPTTGGYADPLIFAAINSFIYGLLAALFNRGMMEGMYGYGIGGGGFSFFTALMAAIMAPIAGIVSILIGAAIIYIVYKILGGTGTYEGTVRFVSYANAVMVIYWIPIIGWIFGLYEIYLYIVGGMFVHKVSMGKSAIAILLPIVLVFFSLVIIMVVLTGYAFSMIFPF